MRNINIASFILSVVLLGCSNNDRASTDAAAQAAQAATDALAELERKSDDGAAEAAQASANAMYQAAADSTRTSNNETNQVGSHAYCDQLADIGKSAFFTKQEGRTMEFVMAIVGAGLANDTQKKTAAQGVIAAIYGDSSIQTGVEAYETVYSACKG